MTGQSDKHSNEQDPIYRGAFTELRMAVCRLEDSMLAMNSVLRASQESHRMGLSAEFDVAEGWTRVLTFRSHEYQLAKLAYGKAANDLRLAQGVPSDPTMWGSESSHG